MLQPAFFKTFSEVIGTYFSFIFISFFFSEHVLSIHLIITFWIFLFDYLLISGSGKKIIKIGWPVRNKLSYHTANIKRNSKAKLI